MIRARLGALLAAAGFAIVSGCAGGPSEPAPVVQDSGSSGDAAAMLRAGNAQGAIRVLSAKPRRTPDEEILLGDACTAIGDADRAASAYYAARAGAGGDSATEFRALCGLGELALRRHDSFVAMARFQEAESFAPGMYERDRALIGQARAELQAGHVDQARQLRAQVRRTDIEGLAELDGGLRTPPPSRPDKPAPALARTSPEPQSSSALARRPKGRGLPPPEILDRSAWGAKPIRPSANPDPMGSIKSLTVHHTADRIGNPGTSQKDNAERVRSYQSAHQDGEHWADIGYHFIIDRQGRRWEGRELSYQGAHAGTPEANEHNVGIALVGNFEKSAPTAAQKKSLTELVQWLCAEYSIPPSRVYAHGEVLKKFAPKRGTDCPGRYLEQFLDELRASIKAPPSSAPPAKKPPVTSKAKR